jgi:hypothetical protein
MFYQQECHLQSAADLRDVARIFLRQVERVDNREQKQTLAERAFALVQKPGYFSRSQARALQICETTREITPPRLQ